MPGPELKTTNPIRTAKYPSNAKPSILCIGQFPPPVHGVSVMNETIASSSQINSRYQLEIINLQFALSFSNLSKFSFKKIRKSFGYAYDIVRSIRKQKPDLVYFTLVPTGFAFFRDAMYISIIKFFKLKTLIHLHGKGIRKNASKSFFRKRLCKFIFKNSSVICLSDLIKDDIADVYSTQPFIVPNGIKIISGHHAPPKLQRTEHRKARLLYLSNFVKSKGLLILIEALGILKEQGYTFEARFAGEFYDLTADIIHAHLEKYSLTPFVTVVGPVGGDDKISEYRNADVFVFPTCFEAFGLVNLEAMQFHLPIVSTMEGGIPDIIVDGETGFLVPKEDAKALAEKIAILIDREELRVNMGNKGYERFLKHFTLQTFEENMSNVFEKVLREGKGLPAYSFSNLKPA